MPGDPSGADDPFARVAKEASGDASKQRGRPKNDGDPITPVPADAPAPGFQHSKLGEAAARWAYRDAAGRVTGYACRFDQADGGKQVMMRTLWRKPLGKLEWRWAAHPAPRIPYGLDRLAAKPDAPVLIVEGEKTADAAAERFPGFACVTWPGGSKAVGKVDFGALRGRRVVVWPDADAPGRDACRAVLNALARVGAALAAAVEPPAYLPQGWDLADEWPAGMSAADAEGMLADALAQADPEPVAWPAGFRMDDGGLWWDKPQDEKTTSVHLAGPFEVIGEARDPDGGGWSVVIRFKDRDGRTKTEIVARAQLSTGLGELRGRLIGEGLFVAVQKGKSEAFASAMLSVATPRRLTLTHATGWAAGDRFVLPHRVIAPSGAEPAMFIGDAAALHYREAGNLDAWRAQIAAKASENPLLMFVLSLAFAGPLVKLLGMSGGGFHLRGPSSCGKTTLALAAGSVWGGGGPLGAAHSWRTTANAMEMIAFGTSETLLVLDELALLAPEEAGQAAYSLASGQAKARSRTDGTLRRRAEWCASILSTGEVSLADHIRAGRRGERPMAGQELRLLDIAADAGRGLGVWHDAGGVAPAVFSDAITAACALHHGLAGPAFLKAVVGMKRQAIADATAQMKAFLSQAQREGDTGQAYRGALRFALVAAAGELATATGVTGWQPGQARDASREVFERWARNFGRDAPREEQDVLNRLREAVEMHGSRFATLQDDEEWTPEASARSGEARSLATLGFRYVERSNGAPEGGEQDQVFYLFHQSGWKEVMRGLDPIQAARVAFKANVLRADSDKHLTKQKRARGEKQRFYWIKAEVAALGGDD